MVLAVLLGEPMAAEAARVDRAAASDVRVASTGVGGCPKVRQWRRGVAWSAASPAAEAADGPRRPKRQQRGSCAELLGLRGTAYYRDKGEGARRCCCERRWRDIELLGPLPVAAGARGTFREVRGDSSWFVR